MAGYRSAFIKSTRLLSGLLPLEGLIRLTAQRLIVPVYHLVSNHPPIHIKHLYQVKSEKQFIDDLDYLLKHYRAIDYATLKTIVDSGKKADKKLFILTFDDGLSEFYDVIAPILLRKGIPAINFLNSDFVGNKDLFFRYKASVLIEAIERNATLLKEEPVKAWMHNNNSGKSKTYKEILLDIRVDQRAWLDVLAGHINVDFKDYLAKNKPYMNQNQISELIQQGFYFGAHSCNHPEYQYLDLDMQLRQTHESMDAIVEAFQLSYRTFAFPFTDFGVKQAFFNQLNKNGQKVDLSFGSAGLKHDTIPFHLQRIPLEMAELSAKEVLGSEYIYFLLKQVLGKNIISRA